MDENKYEGFSSENLDNSDFSDDYEPIENEYPKAAKQESQVNEAPPVEAQPPIQQAPPYNGQQYSQPVYNQPQYSRNQYGQSQYGQPQYGQPQYGQPQYQQAPQYNQPYTQNNQQYNRPQQGAVQQQFANPYSQQNIPAVKKEKLSTGVKVYLAVTSALLVFFIIAFIVMAVQSNSNRNNGNDNNGFSFGSPYENEDNNIFGFPTEEPSESKQSSNNKEDANPNGPSITLNDLPKDAAAGEHTAQTAFDKVSPSVVGIACYNGEITENAQDVVSEGTGIIISADGYIVTNSHVIGDSYNYAIQITTSDNKKYTASIAGYDSRTDLAVLKINAKDLKAAEFGNSELVKTGQDIVAIGNPGGINFQNSLTKGIVSAVERKLSENNIVSYIQTDAAINPGNSGGPLCNLYGQVIGINTAKIASTEYEGMGFAIPSKTVKEIVDDIISLGYVGDRLKIGITGTVVTSSVIQQYNVPQGIIIQEFSEDSSFKGTDAQVNDIITEIDGTKVTSFQDIYSVLENHKEGDKVKVKLYRVSSRLGETGDTFEVEVTLKADKGEIQNR